MSLCSNPCVSTISTFQALVPSFRGPFSYKFAYVEALCGSWRFGAGTVIVVETAVARECKVDTRRSDTMVM